MDYTELAGADGFPMELPIPSTVLQMLIVNYMDNHYEALRWMRSF